MLNFLLLYSAFLMVFLHTQANNSPPLALFSFSDLTYSDAKKQYGLPCANSSIPILGVSSLKYQNSKTKLTFSTEDTTPHGESITLKCDTQNGYYENTYAKTEYTITCKDGSWQGVSMCVRKCKFTKSEFSKEYIVKGRNVSSQSTENQYEIQDFTSATFPSTDGPIQKSDSDYYLNIGEAVRIYCPTTHPPFTSDSTMMKYMNPNTSSFVTTCLSGSTPTQNQWSVEMACYNGFKPCDNTEVTIKTGGEKICNDIGDCFNEFGGKKTDEKGKTIHGARLKLDCSDPWYLKQDYIAPTCRDGNWTSTEAYCKAAFCTADNEIYSATGKKEWNVGYATIESKKVYYGQNYEFKCINSNRVGQKNGKTFKCSFDNQDRITVQQIDTGDWYGRYCTTGCQYDNTIYQYIDNAEQMSYTTTKQDTKSDTYDFGGDPLMWFHSCNSGDTEVCTTIDFLGICWKWECERKWVECSYNTIQSICNGNSITNSNSAITDQKRYNLWHLCTQSGLTQIHLNDQQSLSVSPTDNKRITCNYSQGCK